MFESITVWDSIVIFVLLFVIFGRRLMPPMVRYARDLVSPKCQPQPASMPSSEASFEASAPVQTEAINEPTCMADETGDDKSCDSSDFRNNNQP